MKRGRKFFLRELVKRYIKDNNYGFLLFISDSLKLIRHGVDQDDCLGQKLFFKKEGSLLMGVYNNREIHSHILNGGFESHITKIMSNQIKQGDVCIDVGANIGFYSILMAELSGPSGAVFAFEPVEYNRKKIQLNASLNGLKNITIVDKALGDKSQTLELNVYPEDSKLIGHHSFVINETLKNDQSFEKQLVNVVSIDEWLQTNNISHVDFVKVDIEGFEHSFFKGAKNLLEKNPIIFFEHSAQRIKELDIDESNFKVLLKGYSCYQILSDGLLEYNFDSDMHPYASDIMAIPKKINYA